MSCSSSGRSASVGTCWRPSATAASTSASSRTTLATVWAGGRGRGRLHMIDFPQAVDPQTPDGMALLHRDVVNVFGWFARRGVPCDPESLFGDLVAEAFA